MKIVNLNDYNEDDGLRHKLRKRMDKHEPELPASLWDRIDHEMDLREANRKKRLILWFSSVAMVVLASGIITFMLVKENSSTQSVSAPQVTSPAQNVAPGVTEDGNINNQPSEINAGAGSETGATSNEASGVSNEGNITSSNIHRPNAPTEVDNTNTPAATNPGVQVPVKEDKTDALPPVENVIPVEQPAAPLAGTETDKISEDKPAEPEADKAGDDGKEEEKKEEKGTPKPEPAADTKFQRWFIGGTFGYNQTFRTLTNSSYILGKPTAEDRGKFEKTGYAASYGIEFGFFPVKNFFIKTGVNKYSITERVHYGVVRKANNPTAPGQSFYGDPRDSIIKGNTHQLSNKYSYTQIPLEIGYTNTVAKNLGWYVSAGASLNMLDGYNFNFYEPRNDNVILSTGRNGQYDMKSTFGTEYFAKQFFMLSGSAGLNYSIGKHWSINGGLNYRRAITSSTIKSSGVDTKPYSVGFTTGLMFLF
ncbi:MAG TPA: hypothetical protein VEC12_02230 [Bacteroidia bacterium]|nr:hypothetical protein [Bacteroidia bacterium]